MKVGLYFQLDERKGSGQWLCRNADYWKLKRPPELAKVVVSNNKKSQQLDAAEVLSQQPNDISLQVLGSVKRIEKLLNERLAP